MSLSDCRERGAEGIMGYRASRIEDRGSRIEDGRWNERASPERKLRGCGRTRTGDKERAEGSWSGFLTCSSVVGGEYCAQMIKYGENSRKTNGSTHWRCEKVWRGGGTFVRPCSRRAPSRLETCSTTGRRRGASIRA